MTRIQDQLIGGDDKTPRFLRFVASIRLKLKEITDNIWISLKKERKKGSSFYYKMSFRTFLSPLETSEIFPNSDNSCLCSKRSGIIVSCKVNLTSYLQKTEGRGQKENIING